MRAKLSFLLIVVALVTFGSRATQATTLDLSPTAVGSVVDDAGNIADGTFDRVISTSAPEVAASNNYTYRAVMEFDLSSIPVGAGLDCCVVKPQLHWTLGNSTNPPVDVQLYGYAGDGVLSVNDAYQSNLIATASIPQFDSNDPTFSINVASFLDAAVAAHYSFAGFMFKLAVEPSDEGVQFRDPMLLVKFSDPSTPLPTPDPPSLPLFATGLGLMGLFGWWKRRRVVAA
jgi:hypothetical protein